MREELSAMLENVKAHFPKFLKPVAWQIEAFLSNLRRPTGHFGYSENRYGKVARITGEAHRESLLSYQVPAILKHFGRLEGCVFLDIGAGDIMFGDQTEELGTPDVYFAQDLSRPSLEAGLRRLKRRGFPTDQFVLMGSTDFNLESIATESVDLAFSNSLFSHLTLNSILLCLENLGPKMKLGSSYFSSMIVAHEGKHHETCVWPYLGDEIHSRPSSDPYHYSEQVIRALGLCSSFFDVVDIHEYGHPFQKLVEFRKREEV